MKFGSGVYLTVLSRLIKTEPLDPCVTDETVSVSASISLSFAMTLMSTKLSSASVAESLFATGASLVAVISTVTVAVATPPLLSDMV